LKNSKAILDAKLKKIKNKIKDESKMRVQQSQGVRNKLKKININ
jgi:hypothetical protein